MKIQLVSDLHLEFGDIVIENKGADVLILSGDICVAADIGRGEMSDRKTRFVNFFERVSKEFKNVVYVFGNHEHYHGDFAASADIIKGAFRHLSNVHILDIDSVDIDGVLFVGGTLWTDFKNRDPVVMWDAQTMMNDYRTVRNGPPGMYGSAPKFLPEDAVLYHEQMLKMIDLECKDETRPIVVVGHHAPSFQSISGRYGGDKLNGAYATDLIDFIEQHPQIKLWTHGHIHNNADYMIGSTRVLCNPRGYHGYEENDGFRPGTVFEL